MTEQFDNQNASFEVENTPVQEETVPATEAGVVAE